MRRGFTLVEIIVVMAILAILATLMVGIINPKMLVGRANDSRRKKDMSRIKVAFEEYFNDTGCYPSMELLAELSSGNSCGTEVFDKWGINSWPCDPVSRNPYLIFVGRDGMVDNEMNCPDWYKIYAKLEDEKDKDIPDGWYVGEYPSLVVGDGSIDKTQVNYGVSSSNINWWQTSLNPDCVPDTLRCYYKNSDGSFSSFDSNDVQHLNAYTKGTDGCLVPCCYKGGLCL